MRLTALRLPLAGLLCASLSRPVFASPEAERFPVGAITITEGPFRHAMETDIDYVLAHDPDRLLAPFLSAAGLEPKAEPYGNWESSGLGGHSAGHFLSALSTLSELSDDPRLDERLDYMLSELARCQGAREDGYVGGVPGIDEFVASLQRGEIQAERFALNGRWVPWYNLHKTFAGLKYAWLIAGREQARDILLGIANWAEAATANLTGEQMQAMLYTEHGGMNEIFADLFEQFGDKRYLALARRFTDHELLDPLLAHRDALDGYHANTQIPKVIGIERIAMVDDDPQWQGAAQFFWNTVVQDRSVSIGGNSVREHFNPADDFSSMIASREGPETCNTYNMLRLTDTLFEQAPSAGLVDYYERALYNHILSSRHPETGGLVYFTPMRPRHYRVYSVAEEAFWCCVGSGIENPGRYPEFIYARNPEEGVVFVNLFIPSTVHWPEKSLTLTQKTKFPVEPGTTLEIESAPSAPFTLKIRRPAWIDGDEAFTLRLNDKPIDSPVGTDGYVALRRCWKAGDTVEVALPMSIHTEQLPDDSPYVSFLYGPIVLAARMGTEDMEGLFAGSGRMEHIAPGPYLPLDQAPILVGSTNDLAARVKPVADKPLCFVLTGDIRPEPERPLVLEPFYQIHEARYSIYWQVADEADYTQIQKRLEQEEATRLALAARTVDQVAPGEQQSEVEHNYRPLGETAQQETGAFLGRQFRRASDGFAYTLRPLGRHGEGDEAQALELSLKVFGSEAGKACRVLVNGKEVGRVEMQFPEPDHFLDYTFAIPAELSGAESLEVRLESFDQRPTPMIFELALRRAE